MVKEGSDFIPEHLAMKYFGDIGEVITGLSPAPLIPARLPSKSQRSCREPGSGALRASSLRAKAPPQGGWGAPVPGSLPGAAQEVATLGLCVHSEFPDYAKQSAEMKLFIALGSAKC